MKLCDTKSQKGVVAVAGSAGDVIQVGIEGRWNNATIRNIFYYRAEDVPTAGYLTGLLGEFQTGVLVPYAASQTTQFEIVSVSALNIFSGDVLEDVTPTPAAGTRSVSGEATPSYTAGMILLARENNRVRHGRKFIPLPQEVDISGNAISAGMLTLLTNIANVIDTNLQPGGTDTFAPVIVGRIEYTTPGGKQAYRLPTSQAEMGDKWSYVSDARVINRTTTMNSRKFWRGE